MNTEAFDIQVSIEDPIRELGQSIVVGNPSTMREITVMDERVSALVQHIRLSKLKHDFMLDFVSNPVEFINKWIASQSRDLEVP